MSATNKADIPQNEQQSTTLLIIDQDLALCEKLQNYLEEEGFRLLITHTAEDGLTLLSQEHIDLVLLELMLPDAKGFELLGKFRKDFGTAIIIHTERNEDIDKVVGLEMGADDYLVKPFPQRELLARIRAVLRRYQQPQRGLHVEQKKLHLGPLCINPGAQSVHLHEKTIHLTAAEFALLEALMRSPGNVIDRETLMLSALGRGAGFDDYVLNVHISNLRRKLNNEIPIKTIRGRGYLLSTTVPNKE